MKADAKRDSGGGPERDELRQMLRHWPVPEAPPEIEKGLQRAFRGRRALRRRALWLSLAACVTLLLTWHVRRLEPPMRPAAAPGPVAATALQPPPAPAAERERAPGSTPVAVAPARARRPSGPRRREPEVIVERAQAELLAELGRNVWATRHAAPGTAIPLLPDVEVPRYRQEWEAVAGEWPLVQQSVPIGER